MRTSIFTSGGRLIAYGYETVRNDLNGVYYCCSLFNDGHVLQLRSEIIAVHRRMIYGLDDI